MAEFLNNRKIPEKNEGFNAMGKRVPLARKNRALAHIREMGVTDAQRAMECIDGMSEQIERDQPYKAYEVAMKYVDLTGTFRLFAVLCTVLEGE